MRCPSLRDLPPAAATGTGWPFTEESDPLPDRPPEGDWPRISIVTPSFNQGKWLEEAIRSVLLQGYPNLEYIIMDGGSTDGSVEIIRKYSPWLKHWASAPDGGQGSAINAGFTNASGAIFAWLNSDDYYLRGALRSVAEAWLREGGECAIVGSGRELKPDGRWAVVRNQDGRWSDMKQHGELNSRTVGAWDLNWILQQSCFFPASAFRAAGGIDESLRFALDVDLWFKMLKIARFQSIPECLSVFRLHPDAKTQAEKARAFSETILVQIRHGLESEARRVIEREYSIALQARRILRPFHWLYRLTHSGRGPGDVE